MYIKKNDYVYYKELLLGLRGEYQGIQEQLNFILNEFIKDDNYNAYIKKNNKDTCMYINRRKKDRVLLQALRDFLQGGNIKNKTTLVSYGFDYKRNYVDTDKMDDMNAQTINDFFNYVDIVLSSGLVTNTSDEEYFIEDRNDSHELVVSPSGIMLSADKCNKNVGGVSLSYDPSLDRVHVSPYSMTLRPFINAGGLQDMLDTKIPYDALNPYLINTIISNPDIDMPLMFEDDITDVSMKHSFDFVKDEAKGIVKLKRVK